jgi:hypothetical protein
MLRGTKVLWMLVLALLIVANLALLFLLFRPDRGLTARPADEIQPMVVHLLDIIARSDLEGIRRPRLDQSSRCLSSGCSLRGRLPRLRWRATVGDCNTPGKIERSTDGGASWKARATPCNGHVGSSYLRWVQACHRAGRPCGPAARCRGTTSRVGLGTTSRVGLGWVIMSWVHLRRRG